MVHWPSHRVHFSILFIIVYTRCNYIFVVSGHASVARPSVGSLSTQCQTLHPVRSVRFLILATMKCLKTTQFSSQYSPQNDVWDFCNFEFPIRTYHRIVSGNVKPQFLCGKRAIIESKRTEI